jgi:hypothetical protein
MVPIHPNVEKYFFGDHWLTVVTFGGFLCGFLVWGVKRLYHRWNLNAWQNRARPRAKAR